jgi:hypothetical protein
MKPDELTPAALMKFFSELESGGDDEDCEIHYGCSCVLQKGLHAARMLVNIQALLGGADATAAQTRPAGAEPDAEALNAQILQVEAALMADGEAKPSAPPDEALSAAESEIDRLLLQTVDLKEENKKLKEKIRELYKQIERLYARSEMSRILGGIEDVEAREADPEPADEPTESAESIETPPPSPDEAESGDEAESEAPAEAVAEPGGSSADESAPADVASGEAAGEAPPAESDEPSTGNSDEDETSNAESRTQSGPADKPAD